MSSSDPTDLSQLLSRVNAHLAGTAEDGTALPPPTPSEAMAVYRIAAQLVECELERDGQGVRDRAMTRDVLIGTRHLLSAALEQAEQRPPRPALQVIPGGHRPQ
jgi:hypothetical protein